MKREGRQHGMVRTHRILPSALNRPSNNRFTESGSPPTAGLFTKVPVEPTNHSKFTGKCGRARCSGCRLHPVCKAKAKTKGARKLRSGDVGMNCRLLSWRVVDSGPGLKLFDMSASGILDHLCDDYGELQIEDREESCVERCVEDDDDEGMGFCHVGFVVEHVVEDDDQVWCLVGEM